MNYKNIVSGGRYHECVGADHTRGKPNVLDAAKPWKHDRNSKLHRAAEKVVRRHGKRRLNRLIEADIVDQVDVMVAMKKEADTAPKPLPPPEGTVEDLIKVLEKQLIELRKMPLTTPVLYEDIEWGMLYETKLRSIAYEDYATRVENGWEFDRMGQKVVVL